MIDEAASRVEDLTIRLVPNAGHWVQQEAPEAVNAHLREWLGGAAKS
jgi:pimeloyl-ACP methyl ester carboxylesterase